MAAMTETDEDRALDWEAKNPGTCQKCLKPYKEHRLKPGIIPSKGYYADKDTLCPVNGLERAMKQLDKHDRANWRGFWR